MIHVVCSNGWVKKEQAGDVRSHARPKRPVQDQYFKMENPFTKATGLHFFSSDIHCLQSCLQFLSIFIISAFKNFIIKTCVHTSSL